MSKRNFNLSKQLFITFTVALAFFVVGLVWAAVAWKADYWIKVEFNKISDRYDPALGEVPSGNLFVRSTHWGNMINKVERDVGEDAITAKFATGVAWFDKTLVINGVERFPFGNTDIDFANVGDAGGENGPWYDDELPDRDDFTSPEFYQQNTHFINWVNPDHYWAGAYTSTWFEKPGADASQRKVTISRLAPDETLENVNTKRKPTSGWNTLWFGNQDEE